MRVALFAIVVASFSLLNQAIAQPLPENFALVTVGGTNPSMPFLTAFAFAPDGRIFLTQQNGLVRVIKDGSLLTPPLYQLTVDEVGERGLLGVAVDPEFNVNHFLYLYHTVAGTPAHNRIIRVTVDGDNTVEGSEHTILDLADLSGSAIHNGGAMGFGTDGKLYIAVGDNARGTEAQNLDSYFGKVLRINSDGTAPVDNPFPTGSEERKSVWAYGLRNPFSLGFHPVSGKIFVNDVGQNSFEEVNDASEAGRNFGWPGTEGPTGEASYVSPIYSYKHAGSVPSGCAITGGDFVHAGTNYPLEYVDRYFFVDLCDNWLYSFDPLNPNAEAILFAPVVGAGKLTVVTSPDGELYFLSRGAKLLHKLVYSDTGEPIITHQPAQQSINHGKPVSFTIDVFGDAPMEYLWFKDDVEIEGATANSYNIPAVDYDDAGGYSVSVTNGAGSVVSAKAQLTVGPPNEPPVVSILMPTGSNSYVAGTTIQFSGEATDPEGGSLPAEAFQWYIDFHHDTHHHDQPPVAGASGTFDVPNRNETSANVWYRFILRVTDSQGDEGVDSVDVHPVVSELKFTSSPPGALITIDGQPKFTPYTINGVSGIIRDLHAIEPQVIDGTEYEFAGWSQGGEALQSIITPGVDTEFVATFTPILGLEFNKPVDVYPTLARNEIFISWNSTDVLPAICLTDITGRVHDLPVSRIRDELIVNVQSFPAGIYVLSCTGSEKRFTTRIAVTH